MEPITLCGLVIVCFGLWVEFEPAVEAAVSAICKSPYFKVITSRSTTHKPVTLGRMPICFAKAFHY
jgi:hypothetical protein